MFGRGYKGNLELPSYCADRQRRENIELEGDRLEQRPPSICKDLRAPAWQWHRSRPSAAPYTVKVEPANTRGILVSSFLDRRVSSCLVALSPATRYTNRSRLIAILEWALDFSNDVLVVEGSYPARWDAIALYGLSANTASLLAAREASTFARRANRVITDLRANNEARAFDWAHASTTSSFQGVKAAVASYYRYSLSFRQHIEGLALAFAARRGRTPSASSWKYECLELLSAYVLEEIAMYLHLYQMGYYVEIYPGSSIEIMDLIADGEFEDFPVQCTHKTHIGISVESYG